MGSSGLPNAIVRQTALAFSAKVFVAKSTLVGDGHTLIQPSLRQVVHHLDVAGLIPL